MNNKEINNNNKSRDLPRYLLIPIRVIALLIFILIVFVFSLKLEFVQNWTKEQVLNYVNSNYKQDIHIDNFYFDPFKGFTAGILIKDHHQDTLFYTSNIEVGLYKSLLTLYQGSLLMNELDMNSSVVKIIKYKVNK